MSVDPKAVRALTESVIAFALAESAKVAGDGETVEAIAVTAVIHAAGALAADCAGPGAGAGRVIEVADYAAGQVFNAVSMWHALRTCAKPDGATVQ